MLKRLKIIVLISLLVLAIVIGAVLFLYTYTPVFDRAVVTLINKYSSDTIHIKFKKLSGNLLGTVRLDDLLITTANQDTIRIKRLEADYSLMDFLNERYLIDRILLFQPHVIWHFTAEDSPSKAPSEKMSLDSLLSQFNLAQFPHFELHQLIIKDGDIDLEHAGQQEVVKDVQIEIAAEITERRVAVKPRYIRADWQNRNLRLEDVSFSLLGNKKRITLNQLEAKIPNATLVGHGEVEFEPSFRFLLFADTSRINVSVIKRFQPDFPYQRGFIKVYGSFLGTVGNFKGDLYLGAALDDLRIYHFATTYHRRKQHFFFDNIDFASNFGTMHGTLHLAPDAHNHIDLTVRHLNLYKAGVLNDSTLINARFNLDFNTWNLERFTGKGVMIFTDLQYGAAHIDTVQLRISANQGNWKFLQPSEVIFAGDSRFQLQGTLTDDKNLDVSLTTEQNNLGALFRSLAVENAGGTGSLYLHVFGDVNDPNVEGNVEIDSISVANSVVYGIDGELVIDSAMTRRKGTFSLELATGYVGNIFLTNGQVKSRFTKDYVVLDPLQFYSEENSIRLKGVIYTEENSWRAIFSRLKIKYEDYLLQNDKPVWFIYRNDTLFTRFFSLRASVDEYVTASGFITFRGNSNFSLEANHIRLAPVNQYLYWDNTIGGMIDARMDVFGTINNPEVEVMVTLKDLALNQHPLGKLQTEVIYQDGTVAVNFLDFERDSTSYITLNGSVDIQLQQDSTVQNPLLNTPLDINVVMSNIRLEDYAFLYPTNIPIRGSLSGRLELGGTVANPSGSWNFGGQQVDVGEYYFPEFNADGRLRPDRVTIDLARVNFFNTVILLNGEKPIVWDPENPDTLFSDKSFRLRVKIDEDSLNFLAAVNPELDRLIGDIHISGLVEGDYDAPQLSESQIEVKDGTLYLAKLDNSIQNIELTAHQEDSRLLIDRFKARSPRSFTGGSFIKRWIRALTGLLFSRKKTGDITGKGWIDFTDLFRPKLNLHLSMKNAYFNYFLENTEVVLNTNNLYVHGRDTISVEGDITVTEGDVEFSFAESEQNVLLSTTIREQPPFLRYDLNLDILPNFYVRSTETFNNFDMKLSGELRVIQEPRSSLEMYGSLETDGKYFIQGEDFEIQNGKIDFVNPKELPEVNLFAQKRKNNMVFNLNVRGKLNAPEKEITILDEQGNTLYYPDVKDQMALLLFGVTFNQLSSSADSVLLSKGEQVITQAVISAIEKEARTFTGLDQVRLDTQESFFRNRLNRTPTLSLGKYLTPKLYLEYKTQLAASGIANIPKPQLSWEAGNQIYLLYRLNRRWSFSTIFQKTQEGNDKIRLDISWQINF